MKKSILSGRQKVFLGLLSKNKNIVNDFYLSGGTALAEYYIPYRFSEDLDFFSENEIDINSIIVFLKSIKTSLGFEKFDLNTSYNRNIIVLRFGNNKMLKSEFTYFPFPSIEKPKTIGGIRIDSVLDIAVNKIFTIYQNPRSRDFMDLFMINKKYNFQINDLLKKARIKFDWHIDLLKLGAQLLLAKELKDYPKLLEKLNESDWQSYYESEAKALKDRIIKP
ncbi:nucleotidyl transferase AbiEii/AbiGii toxin family protein [Candidatus Saganbacteria bacterium]|nr:nucleotidyl transferase AbiEii/AbiGii toxin family protein [Candidatus Saganbacteria bacterium]